MLMIEITEENAAEILHARGHLPSYTDILVHELSGGVSNAVFLVETPECRFVVKQARGKLRVQADWQCSVERIWREMEALQTIGALLDAWRGTSTAVPRILWRDHELYAYAMTAAAANACTWKEKLLSGQLDVQDADRAGALLGRIHARSWHDPKIASAFEDRTYFAQLRLEPYYLVAAEKYPTAAGPLRDLVDQTWRERHTLVHGDFSPKNLLVWDPEQMLIDFEVGHYGDPAFDVGFCLTHLVLKSIHRKSGDFLTLADSLRTHWHIQLRHIVPASELQTLEHRAIRHLAGCLIARIHGKSPVDYLRPAEQDQAVQIAEKLFELGSTVTWDHAFTLLQRVL